MLSMMKFKGFGGETGYWDACLEYFTLMSALAAKTKTIGLIPTVTLLSQHPAFIARMVSTLNDISGGRCGLNIVTGCNEPEYQQMGLWRCDEYYDRRYELTAEYVAILQDLWRQGNCTRESKFFSLNNCSCLPVPGREMPIVSAGQSPKGVDFVAQNVHQNFVMAHPENSKISVIVSSRRA